MSLRRAKADVQRSLLAAERSRLLALEEAAEHQAYPGPTPAAAATLGAAAILREICTRGHDKPLRNAIFAAWEAGVAMQQRQS